MAMFNRDTLIQRWTTRLAEAEAQLATAAPRTQWWHRVSVRLYRFLLTSYGAGDWRRDQDPEASGDGAHSGAGELIDNVGSLDGKRPKAVTQIRQVLDGIRDANPPGVGPGPLTRADCQDAWVAAAAQSAHIQPRRCVRLLREQGIAARSVRRSDDVIVEVRGRDLEEAVRLIAEKRETLRPRSDGVASEASRPGLPRRSVGAVSDASRQSAVWAALLVLSAVILLVSYHSAKALAVAAVFVLVAASAVVDFICAWRHR